MKYEKEFEKRKRIRRRKIKPSGRKLIRNQTRGVRLETERRKAYVKECKSRGPRSLYLGWSTSGRVSTAEWGEGEDPWTSFFVIVVESLSLFLLPPFETLRSESDLNSSPHNYREIEWFIFICGSKRSTKKFSPFDHSSIFFRRFFDLENKGSKFIE